MAALINKKTVVRSEVLTVAKMTILLFWIVTSYRLVGRYTASQSRTATLSRKQLRSKTGSGPSGRHFTSLGVLLWVYLCDPGHP
jgi:hypothetical protein